MTLTDKKTLRIESKAKVLAMSDQQRRSASASIFGRLARTDIFARARVVALYMSLPDEPQTEYFLREMCHRKRLVVPRVCDDCTMRFFDYRPDGQQPGAFGIAEPDDDARPCPPEDIDLMVVPGTAFTREGARLGRGRGYYDRYMAQPQFRAATVGVCFGVQIVDALPVESHDLRVDAVITDEE